MKRLIYAGALLAGLTLTGCQDEDAAPTPTLTPSTPKLDYYVESYEVAGLGFQPQIKVAYEYNGMGKVSRYTVLSYNPATGSTEEQRYFAFSYLDGRVDKLAGYLPKASSPYIEYFYEYQANGNVSRIREHNYGTGVNSEANFSYDAVNNTINVAYTFSNGGSFQYEFQYDGENIQRDKTSRGSQLCSDGVYTYDDHVNPFRNLGYVDYTLNNLSVNNKLSEDVSYVACGFPTLVPESYAYEYNADGYPTEVMTTYKSGGSLARAKKEIYYK